MQTLKYTKKTISMMFVLLLTVTILISEPQNAQAANFSTWCYPGYPIGKIKVDETGGMWAVGTRRIAYFNRGFWEPKGEFDHQLSGVVVENIRFDLNNNKIWFIRQQPGTFEFYYFDTVTDQLSGLVTSLSIVSNNSYSFHISPIDSCIYAVLSNTTTSYEDDGQILKYKEGEGWSTAVENLQGLIRQNAHLIDMDPANQYGYGFEIMQIAGSEANEKIFIKGNYPRSGYSFEGIVSYNTITGTIDWGTYFSSNQYFRNMNEHNGMLFAAFEYSSRLDATRVYPGSSYVTTDLAQLRVHGTKPIIKEKIFNGSRINAVFDPALNAIYFVTSGTKTLYTHSQKPKDIEIGLLGEYYILNADNTISVYIANAQNAYDAAVSAGNKIDSMQTDITNIQNNLGADTTPPVVRIRTLSGAMATSGNSIGVVLEISDNKSTEFTYSANGVSYSPVPSNNIINLSLGSVGPNTKQVWVKDEADNIGTATITIRKI